MRFDSTAARAATVTLLALTLVACGADSPSTPTTSPPEGAQDGRGATAPAAASAGEGAATGEDAAGRMRTEHDVAAVLHEYRATMDVLTLPAGVTPREPVDPGPEELPGATSADGTVEPGRFADSAYEPGYGMTLAHMGWFCAWEQEWLAQRGVEPAAEAAALAMLETMPATETWSRFMDETTQESIRVSLARAATGDPTGVQADVDRNCR